MFSVFFFFLYGVVFFIFIVVCLCVLQVVFCFIIIVFNCQCFFCTLAWFGLFSVKENHRKP